MRLLGQWLTAANVCGFFKHGLIFAIAMHIKFFLSVLFHFSEPFFSLLPPGAFSLLLLRIITELHS